MIKSLSVAPMLGRAVFAFGVAAVGSGFALNVLAAELAIPAADPTVRLISEGQYVNTIARTFGPDIAVRIRFAPVKRVDGLVAVGAASAVLTGGGLDPLESSARAVSTQVVDPAHRSLLVQCEPANPKAPDQACARDFFKRIGRLIYRRPLTDEELTKFVDTAGRGVGPSGDFYAGLAYVLSGMLVSPDFLFITETSAPDAGNPDAWQLDASSKASRLSFLFWNGPPDDELLTAAARGDLDKPKGLQKQVDRMIASPYYQDGVRAFFNDFFGLEAFDTLTKDPIIYPAFSLKAVEEAREQVLRMAVDHLVVQHGDYRNLFTTRRTQISSELGTLYRIPVDVGAQGWVPYEFSRDDPRSGILTQIGFLAQYAHPGRSSPTRRGRAIREVLLCQKVPDPPPNVDFSKFEDPKSPLPTARERLTRHRENPVCAGCHRVTDPIGLGLENFDGAGQFRATEKDGVIDASGELDGVAFKDAAGLGKAVHDNPALKSCIVKRLYAFSVGREVMPAEKPLLAQYQTTLDKKGYHFDEMLRLMVLDKSFFAVKPAQVDDVVAPPKTAYVGDTHAD